MDAFLAHCYLDEQHARGLADALAGRGLEVADPVSLWPGDRLLPRLDQRLASVRHAVVLVTPDFLKLGFPRKELDGVANRRRVIALLVGVHEADVAGVSPRLAVAAFPWTERIIRLMRGDP